MFTTESRVGDIAVEQPSATRSFYRFGIDFCCGGGKSISSVCAKKGIDVAEVLRDIELQKSGIQEAPNTWNAASLPAIIAHIISQYHEPLRTELPRLGEMLDKVQRVHGHVDPERFDRLQAVYNTLVEELLAHMGEEERVLFPLIMQGSGATATETIAALEGEHEAAGDALRTLRELTDDYTPPSYACNTWRALWAGLADLESTMHQHVHLENNILFPRAMAS